MRYDLILADPPWQFKTWSDKGQDRSPDNHYITQDIEWLKNLPVETIAAKNSLLLMWTTKPLMEQAFQVMRAWGFVPKTCLFAWAKKNGNDTFKMGLGYYSRANMEDCWLATRGQPLRPVVRNVSQIQFADRPSTWEEELSEYLVTSPLLKHSEKPQHIMSTINTMWPTATKVELFARRYTEGWTCVGNELTGHDIVEDIQLLSELSEQKYGY